VPAWYFSKVSPIVNLHKKFSSKLTFEKLLPVDRAAAAQLLAEILKCQFNPDFPMPNVHCADF